MTNKNKILNILAEQRHNDWLFFVKKCKIIAPASLTCGFNDLPKAAKYRHIDESKKLLKKISNYITINDDLEVEEVDLNRIKAVAELVLERKFIWTKEAKNSLRILLSKGISIEEVVQAFLNLKNEPDLWKITNNRSRGFTFWLKSPERIYDMLNCHLKGKPIHKQDKKEWTPPVN